MQTLIFLLVILSTNLVFSDDNVAIESSVGYQVHAPSEETLPENDQQADSSNVINHTHAQRIPGADLKDVQAVRQSHDETLKYSDRNGYTYEVQNVLEQPQQQTIQGIRYKPIVVNGGDSHSVPSLVYSHQEQQIGTQQYPTHQVQIYNAQAAPLQQVYDNEHAIGYQTYVEHVPEGEDEEIKSALKENSLGDIKRLVPKSGISFKIYHNDKTPNVRVTEHKIETQPDVFPVTLQTTQKEFPKSILHHRTRVQAPVQELQIQTPQTHQELEKPQQIYLQHNPGHHTFENQPILHQGQAQRAQVYYTQQEVSSLRPVAYTQPEVSSPRPVLEITGKGTANPPYKIKIRDDHARATSSVEFNKNTGSNNVRYQQSVKNFHKQLKPGNVQYQKEISEVQKLSHNEGLGSFISHEEPHPYSNVRHVTPQDQFLHSQLADSKPGQILNRLSGNYISEGVKSSLISHPGIESQYKNIQNNLWYADNEVPKTQQNTVSYGTQSSPNNFDHQKALEGSTSFDIKNAIGITEGTDTQTNYVSTTEIHPTEELQKQQLVYNLQVPTVLVENSVLKTPIDGHQIKALEQVIPQFVYHPQEMGGKFYRQPQFVWTTEHVKEGNELHQPLINLHVPKNEIQYAKVPKVESIITHQHQPLLVHQNVVYKPYELSYQHKKYPQGHQPNLKISHPVIIDWSLFKSKFPNVNINSLKAKPELLSYIQDPTKKIMPILVRKRKNRSSSNNKEVAVVYGKTTNRGPAKPNQRQEKNVHVNLVPSASSAANQFERKGERKNEFSVSASYKVDRSYKSAV